MYGEKEITLKTLLEALQEIDRTTKQNQFLLEALAKSLPESQREQISRTYFELTFNTDCKDGIPKKF